MKHPNQLADYDHQDKIPKPIHHLPHPKHHQTQHEKVKNSTANHHAQDHVVDHQVVAKEKPKANAEDEKQENRIQLRI